MHLPPLPVASLKIDQNIFASGNADVMSATVNTDD